MRVGRWVLLTLVLSPLGTAAAQQQQASQQPAQQEDSLAAAARRTRDQKKDQAKPKKIYDNDNLPATPGGVNVVGQTESESGTSSAGTAEPNAASPAGGNGGGGVGATDSVSNAAKNKAAISAELSAAKEQLQNLKNDLDILQRKFTLDQQTYYSKPDYSSDKEGAAKLKDERNEIEAKQQEVADAQKKVDELQSNLNPASDNK
jgi:hypothetical protein